MFVLGDAVGFDFFFIGQAQTVFAAVFTIGVPGGALAYFERAGYVKGVGAELDDLLDALVLGAVGVGEGAVRAGAVGGGAGGGVVGEDFAAGSLQGRFWLVLGFFCDANQAGSPIKYCTSSY
jgi:hypothetical protein